MLGFEMAAASKDCQGSKQKIGAASLWMSARLLILLKQRMSNSDNGLYEYSTALYYKGMPIYTIFY